MTRAEISGDFSCPTRAAPTRVRPRNGIARETDLQGSSPADPQRPELAACTIRNPCESCANSRKFTAGLRDRGAIVVLRDSEHERDVWREPSGLRRPGGDQLAVFIEHEPAHEDAVLWAEDLATVLVFDGGRAARRAGPPHGRMVAGS